MGHEVGRLVDHEPDPVVALITLARGHAVFCRRDVARVAIALRLEFGARDHPVGREVKRVSETLVKRCARLIDAGRESGSIPPGPARASGGARLRRRAGGRRDRARRAGALRRAAGGTGRRRRARVGRRCRAPTARGGGPRMRLPNTAHTSRPWRIHELTRDFRLEDVWALPTPGGPDDFPGSSEHSPRATPRKAPPALARAVGDPLEGRRAARLGRPGRRRRLPGADAPRPAAGRSARRPRPARTSHALPFTPLYLLEDEWAAEIANRTMHGVMHIGWVPDGDRRLPRPDGRPGEAERPAWERPTWPRSGRSGT